MGRLERTGNLNVEGKGRRFGIETALQINSSIIISLEMLLARGPTPLSACASSIPSSNPVSAVQPRMQQFGRSAEVRAYVVDGSLARAHLPSLPPLTSA